MEKWTPALWLTSSMAELYEGTENITSPAAAALLVQAGIRPSEKGAHNTASDDSTELIILDNGAGLGQLTEVLLEDPQARRRLENGGKVICGDTNASLLETLKAKAKKWKNVEVLSNDTHAMNLSDNSLTHVFSNFVYMLVPNPIDALKESIRVLKPGGTLGFTTWAHPGLLYLLQHAFSLMVDIPNMRTIESAQMVYKTGYWHEPAFVRSTLADLGLTNIKISPFDFKQTAESPIDMARKMRVLVPIMTGGWKPEIKKERGWEVFERIEEIMKGDFGDGPCHIRSVALVVTATKPS